MDEERSIAAATAPAALTAAERDGRIDKKKKTPNGM